MEHADDETTASLGSKRNVARPPMLTLSKCQSIGFRTPQRPHRIEEETLCGLMWSVAARRGRRRANREDMYSVLPFVDEGSKSEPISIFAVFDGHGGQRVAKFASTRLPDLFLKAYEKSGDEKFALECAFLGTDQEIIQGFTNSDSNRATPEGQEFRRTSSGSTFASTALQRGASGGPGAGLSRGRSRKSRAQSQLESIGEVPGRNRNQPEGPTSTAPRSLQKEKSSREPFKRTKSRADENLSSIPVNLTRACGTTATVVVLVGDQFSVAHVGDSRAVLSNQNGAITRLFEDHKPGRRDEMERIESAGGLVVKVSGTFRVNGVLAVSRAIGDAELKKYVISKPDVWSFSLSGEEEFLIMASDGLWDHVTDAESVQLVRDTILFESGEDGLEEKAAKLLVQSAWDRGSNDDVSVIVVNLLKYARCKIVKGSGDDGAILEEMVEEIDLEKLSTRCVENGNDFKMEMVTPMATLPLETPRTRKPSPW